MKYLAALSIAIAVTLVTSTTQASAATPPDSCFAFSAGTGTITDYYDHEGNNPANPACTRDVDIPSTISGTPVTVIGSYAFASNQLTSMTLPATLVTISSHAFAYNQITDAVIPAGVTTIGAFAFSNNRLVSVDIPSSVSSIQIYTFDNNQLESLTLPASITTIGSSAFSYNLLTELNLPSSLTTLGYSAFHANKLRSVIIPDSLTSLSPSAFSLQNEWGSMIDRPCAVVDPAPCMWSNDQDEVQRAYDSIWYTKVYTQSGNNPNNLRDSILTETNYAWADTNGNGLSDSFGGHIINPASLELNYISTANSELRTSLVFVGRLNDDIFISTYHAVEGPAMPDVMDTENPTPAEQLAIDQALSAYYRIGDSVTIDPPAIDGYITPEPQTFVLGAADNTFSYVYAAADSSGGGAPATPVSDEDELADTGISSIVYAASAVVMTSLGAVILTRRI